MTFETWFQSTHANIPVNSANAVLSLTGEGGTVPFIARYRKEQTGALDEVAIQNVIDAKERWDEIIKRQTFIVEEIERQGKLTDELKEKILSTFKLDSLEDIYLPYKQKRKTKATIAKEAGLEPFADWIWDCGHGTATPEPGQTLEIFALAFYNPEKNINDAEAAISGALDILTERLAETQELREFTRKTLFERGVAKSAKSEKAKEHSKYERYFDHHEPIQSLLKPENSHRYLAMRRGWTEEELALTIGGAPEDTAYDEILLARFESEACAAPDSPGAELLRRAAKLALKGYVIPSIENEAHRELKEVADEAAIKVFAENVRKLLLASPFGSKAVLGVDPGVRTGCKLAVVDDSEKFLADNVMYLQSKNDQETAKKMIGAVLQNASIRAIAVGNGTAGRETESFIRDALRDMGLNVPVVMVNESGASVYSASAAAREEFPDLDVTVRGAISIARRLQDPLAELVKIDPKSIGVGQYQHDVDQKRLRRSLEEAVESCVNRVGVDVNTASAELLQYVSGLNMRQAQNLVAYRNAHGRLMSRQQLLQVEGLGDKTFQQAAGFLRIKDGEQLLDSTAVHPETYGTVERMATSLAVPVAAPVANVELINSLDLQQFVDDQVGLLTLQDIREELLKPGRDPRAQFVMPRFRDDVTSLAHLQEGMVLEGVISNVTNFGAFVDIGVHQDGLVHISELSQRYVRDPREVVQVGQIVKVRVLGVDVALQRISLSMKGLQPTPEQSEGSHKGAAGPARRRRKRAAPPKPPAAPAPETVMAEKLRELQARFQNAERH